MTDINGPALIAEWMWYYTEVANVGYSQPRRRRIRHGGAMDCSSGSLQCSSNSGYEIGGAYWTGNMRSELVAAGWQWIPKFSVDDLRPGDLLLADGHVVVYMGPRDHPRHGHIPHAIGEANLDENGDIYGPQDGDQTGEETRTRPYYTYPGGWLGVLRAPAVPHNPAAVKWPPHLPQPKEEDMTPEQDRALRLMAFRVKRIATAVSRGKDDYGMIERIDSRVKDVATAVSRGRSDYGMIERMEGKLDALTTAVEALAARVEDLAGGEAR